MLSLRGWAALDAQTHLAHVIQARPEQTPVARDVQNPELRQP